MMTETKTAPTLEVMEHRKGNAGYITVNANGKPIAEMNGINYEALEWAEKIARSVNAHEELLKHGKIAAKILREFWIKNKLDSADEEVLDNFEAAIAKAEVR